MVDGGVTIMRWRLHGLGEGDECMLLLRVAVTFKVFVMGEEEMGDCERGVLW
jgi:hypothetical protein